MIQLPDWVASAQAENVVTWIFGVLAILTIAQALVNARTSRSLFPIFLFIGGALSVFYEPTNDLLGHCYYTQNGMRSVWFETFGRKIPTFIGFTFFFYYYQFIWLCLQLLGRGISEQKWMIIFFGAAASALLFELIPIHYHLWGYYGDNQPIKIYGFPLWWAFVNAECLMSIAVILHLLRRYVLTGWAVSLSPLSMPILTFMTHGGAALPATVALNSSDSIVVTTIASILSMAVATFMVWGGHRLIAIIAERAAGRPEALYRQGSYEKRDILVAGSST